MRFTSTTFFTVLMLLPAVAEAADEPPPRIIVSGTGTSSSPPDRAAIAFGVHGEGATSDEAVSAMVAKRKAIEGGLSGFSAESRARTSQVTIVEVRGPDCNRNTYGNPRLSTGECAIVGYTADLAMEIRTGAIKDAGTIVGVIGRLGGTNPRLERFFLSSDRDARRLATGEALADAKRQAEAIALGTGVRLGALLSASNTGGFDAVRSYDDLGPPVLHVPAPPPPPPPPPPIAVDVAPRPIETQVRVQVVYAIQP